METISMTPEEVAKKYPVDKDGNMNLPANLRIIMPDKETAASATAKAREAVKGVKSTNIENMEIMNGNVYVDGKETRDHPGVDLGNRAYRRAKGK